MLLIGLSYLKDMDIQMKDAKQGIASLSFAELS